MIVYAVMYNGCTYESAAATVSLHTTKAGAWKAMRKFMFDMVTNERDFAIEFGGRRMMRRTPMFGQAFGVQAYEVVDDGLSKEKPE